MILDYKAIVSTKSCRCLDVADHEIESSAFAAVVVVVEEETVGDATHADQLQQAVGFAPRMAAILAPPHFAKSYRSGEGPGDQPQTD